MWRVPINIIMVWLGFQERTVIGTDNLDPQLRCMEALLAKTVIMIASSFSYYPGIIKRGNLESLSLGYFGQGIQEWTK